MVAYSIYYKIRGKDIVNNILVDAKDLKSAKRKIGRKHGYKDGRMVQIQGTCIIGYY